MLHPSSDPPVDGSGNPVVYDNGEPDLSGAVLSDIGSDDPLQQADNFRFDVLTELTDFHWWGIYDDSNNPPPAEDNFTIQIFETLDDTPIVLDLVGEVGRVDTGANLGGSDLYEYWVNIEPLTLDPGEYFLSIANDTTGKTADWYWALSDDEAGHWSRSDGQQAWDSDSGDLAFKLTGTNAVPEPGTVMLVGFGLVGVWLFKRRRSRGKCRRE